MTGEPGAARPEPLEEFVAELVRLRGAAGNPSFREMAAKSGAVSHATLHQTITGNRLQPWETVREFVRACDGDEAALYEHWERTNLALAENNGDEHAGAAVSDGGGRTWRRLPRWSRTVAAIAGAVAVVVVVTAVTVTLVEGGSASPSAGDSASPKAATKSKTPAGPATPGDASKFVKDVTIPDGTVVEPDSKFVKVWEFKNIGSVKWRNRYLQRTDAQQDPTECHTPRRVPIADTDPQETVEISVKVATPSMAPVDCKVEWKMVDESGKLLFPSLRPVYFLVRVRN